MLTEIENRSPATWCPDGFLPATRRSAGGRTGSARPCPPRKDAFTRSRRSQLLETLALALVWLPTATLVLLAVAELARPA